MDANTVKILVVDDEETILNIIKEYLEATDSYTVLTARDGIEAEVVDLRSLRPLDTKPILNSFKKTFKAIVVEEGYRSYGVGAEIVARIQEEGFDYLDAPIKRVAQLEVPLPYSQQLEQLALINTKRVIEAVKEIV